MEWDHRQLLWLNRRCQIYLGCHCNGAALRGRETAALQPSQGLKLLHGAFAQPPMSIVDGLHLHGPHMNIPGATHYIAWRVPRDCPNGAA